MRNTDASIADDPNSVVTVPAQLGKSGKAVTITYSNCKVVGNGSFGVVYAAKMTGGSGWKRCTKLQLIGRRIEEGGWVRRPRIGNCDQEGVAGQAFQGGWDTISTVSELIVVQNRELQIMRLVAHPNVVDLKAFFYSNGDKVGYDFAVAG
jgi:glycogen synthase kinase 3 beta